MRARTDQKSSNDYVPGPGAYETKKDNTVGKTMVGRHYERDAAPVPGPGAYDTQRKEKGGVPSYSFGLKTQEVVSAMENPGPGAYTVGMCILLSFCFAFALLMVL